MKRKGCWGWSHLCMYVSNQTFLRRLLISSSPHYVITSPLLTYAPPRSLLLLLLQHYHFNPYVSFIYASFYYSYRGWGLLLLDLYFGEIYHKEYHIYTLLLIQLHTLINYYSSRLLFLTLRDYQNVFADLWDLKLQALLISQDNIWNLIEQNI